MTISGDSGEYEYITEGVVLSREVEGRCIELGVRRGMGTKTIMEAIAAFCPHKTAVAVDPYGSILYQPREHVEPCRLDYTNQMRNECMADLYTLANDISVNFAHIGLEDTEFFTRYADGVPVYDIEKKIINKYSFVHFDGPHDVVSILNEIEFFHDRTDSGATFVFDDVTDDFYPHDSVVEPVLLALGYELIKKGCKKALYKKL